MNKRYDSIRDMVRDVSDSSFASEFEEAARKRQIITRLMALRSARGMTQQDVAEKMDCTQSRVSKLEAGNDLDLRLGDFANYANSLKLDIELHLVKHGERSMDRIKRHAFAIQRELTRMTELAHKDKDIADGVCDAHLETLVNLVRIIVDSAKKLPESSAERHSVLQFHFDEDEEEECDDGAHCGNEPYSMLGSSPE